MAAVKKEQTVRLIFSYYACTIAVKLNFKWQMTLILKKINLDIIDRIALLIALHEV